jgi:LysM repeat protein
LSKIAKEHGTTWQAIRDLNNLPTTSIKVGQQLKIPATKPAAGGTGTGGF